MMATIQKRKNKNGTNSYLVMIRPEDGLSATYKTFPTAIRRKDGNTILHLACARRDVEMIRFLVESGADQTLKNRQRRTAQDLLKNSFEESTRLLTRTVRVFSLDKDEYENNFTNAQNALLKNSDEHYVDSDVIALCSSAQN